MSPKKIETEAELYAEVEKNIRLVLLSSNKKDITKAFTSLECIINAKCICSFCDGIGDLDFVYEFSRCLISTRTMQLIKERHLETPRWSYIGPKYTKLYEILYEDLNPLNNKRVFSNGEMENIICKFTLPKSVYIDARAKINTEKELRIKFKAQNPV